MAVLTTSEIKFTAFEPKLQNRFVMYISDEGVEIPTFMVRAADIPSYTDEVVTLHHINTYRKIRGKREWEDITLTLYDPISPSGAQAAIEWARLGYESVTGRAGYSDLYKKEVRLHQVGPVGDTVSEWLLKGAFPSAVDFGSLDWESSDTVDITLTLSYDYAVLNY